MGKIKILDDLTIKKIAAGEVVERPLSIVKEMVENSLDANAINITIEIKDGGKSYIRITDDGDGIGENDLDLAFQRHSTSKLTNIEDLYQIKSLGFRGEALSSISNVSKVEVMSKTKDSLAGIQAMIEEGQITSKEIIGCPKGTTMIIRDLFYNLPVRKRFLKSDLIESNQISDIVYKMALGNSSTSFKFIRDNKVVLNTSKNNSLRSHIYSVLGKEFSKNLVEIDVMDKELKISGYVSNNQLYRSNRSHQYIYINGRYISNINISNVIEANFKTILPLNKFPVFILFIEIDPANIDVNIHPTKQEVKFANHGEVMRVIDNAIRSVLYPSMSIAKINLKNKPKKQESEPLPLLFNLPKNNMEEDIIIKDLTKEGQLPLTSKPNIYIGESRDKCEYDPIPISHDLQNSDKDIENILSKIEPMGVIFGTYILAEDKSNEKFYFIDQHAAHERVMYERYLREYRKEGIVTQQLLAPEILELTDMEMTNFIENISVFKSLGLDVEEFGNNSVAIRGVPLLFGTPNVGNLFYDILDNIQSQIKSSYNIKLEKIMKIACVNSIKAGDNINNIEILSLFEQLKVCKNPHTCPHGRPTILEMTRRDIEKEFLRIN